MKHYRKELWFNTKTRRDYINITDQVQGAIYESGIKEGLCLVNAMHISASVYINDDESGQPTKNQYHSSSNEPTRRSHIRRAYQRP